MSGRNRICLSLPREARRGALVAALGLCLLSSYARGQDSVSTTNGFPGDAINAYSTAASHQRVAYVVDLATRTSSWNNAYALGPIVKASRANVAGYFNLLVGAQAVSDRFSYGALNAAVANYGLWTTAGQGANPDANSSPGSSVAASGKLGQQLGLAFMEYGPGPDAVFGDGDDENSIIGASVDFQFRNVNRLYVTRTVAIVNKSSAAAGATASFGLGGVDELGDIHVAADGYGLSVAGKLAQRVLYRAAIGARSTSTLSTVAQSSIGDPGAVSVVRSTLVSTTMPAMISPTAAGGAGRPVALTTDLGSNYVYEASAGSTSVAGSAAYLPSGDQPRGSLAFVPQTYAPVAIGADVGTAATLVHSTTSNSTRGIEIMGVHADGSLDGSLYAELPTDDGDMIDPVDGYVPGVTFSPITSHEFTNYASQVSFRGGASQVAMTVLPSGDLLASVLVAASGGGSAVPQSENTYLVVGHFDSGGNLVRWTVAAHTGDANGAAGGLSKAILARDSSGVFTTIGHIAHYTEVFGDASAGPSLSSPAMDRAGNLYFIAAVSLNDPPPSGAGQVTTLALLRANRIAATDGYQLELLAEIGDVIAGPNSGKNYEIASLALADADSADSGTIFSNSVVQDSIAGANATTAPFGSPVSLGALAFKARIVYDVNSDGSFVDPSGINTTSTSPDQAYDVVMLLMPRIKPGDFNRDGAVNVSDIFAFLRGWFGQTNDFNGDGSITVSDIFDFLRAWFQG